MPSWSNDSARILFVGDRHKTGPFDTNSEIYVMDANGTNQTRLTNNTFADITPSYAPDDTAIVYVQDRGVGSQIVTIMQPDGTGIPQMAFGRDPAWSPDGTRIAYATDNNTGAQYEIFLMTPDGAQSTRRTRRASFEGMPAWSVDGNQLPFVSDRPSPGHPAYNLFIMNTSGTVIRQVTSSASVNFQPSWAR